MLIKSKLKQNKFNALYIRDKRREKCHNLTERLSFINDTLPTARGRHTVKYHLQIPQGWRVMEKCMFLHLSSALRFLLLFTHHFLLFVVILLFNFLSFVYFLEKKLKNGKNASLYHNYAVLIFGLFNSRGRPWIKKTDVKIDHGTA